MANEARSERNVFRPAADSGPYRIIPYDNVKTISIIRFLPHFPLQLDKIEAVENFFSWLPAEYHS